VILSIARHTVLNARSECNIVGCVTDATDASYCRHFRGGMSTHVLHSQSFTAHVGAATLQARSSSCCRRRTSDPTVRSEFESQCETDVLRLNKWCSNKLSPAPLIVRRGLKPGLDLQV